MAEVWTIGRCLTWIDGYLAKKGDERPRLSAEWLLSSVLHVSRVELYTSFDRPLAAPELDRLRERVIRRANGEPLQYIVGTTQFRGITVRCEPGVLIPRPETELLVEEVLSFIDAEVLHEAAPKRKRAHLPWSETMAKFVEAEAQESHETSPEEDAEAALSEESYTAEASEQNGASHARVLEIGCGTGCISLAIAAERPGQISCVAIDIDEQAVRLAASNREALHVDPEYMDIRTGDMIEPVDTQELGSFDVLVSNPPYIPDAVMEHLPQEVALHEPRLALAGGADGLDVFRCILVAAPQVLRHGGLLACELHEDSLEDAAALCISAGMELVRIEKDLAGRNRFICARTP
ncbi:peptide chain release factor N(5)-glutamine methyltransferase [Collinsella sp. AGMB00827]|uniref:Release factor glutamine methyltransferase n=1 Tax=Collinsella ureilytica TaxID=2869515 RepID=A0ABS7MJP5_9ACTN|nr:HemK/PrmC family methyltransferase [Collinsella urealyticum]MBY4797596.1 peptide chain release factor N(5)-glutamine methyltransferase [Collinsella urealyticum]